jgi:hypothetical protein
MKFIKELQVKGKSQNCLSPYWLLVVVDITPSPNSIYTLLGAMLGVQNPQGPHYVSEATFKWQEDYVYCE